MKSVLDQLRNFTTVVADTGDINAIAKYRPEDATTNPSIILNSINNPEYEQLLDEVIAVVRDTVPSKDDQIAEASDMMIVTIGKKILEVIPGRISTEVDARLSFSTEKTVEKARRLISLYESKGISRNRVLIKIASTWEGIRAAEILEKEDINCNLTLLFSFAQARACAEAGVYLISPFVGRILDWYKEKTNLDYTGENDPGVKSVKDIYDYYKRYDYKTIVMGASFRNTSEIILLAGCDRLTISPSLLDQLSNDFTEISQKLSFTNECLPKPSTMTEQEFRWLHNEDEMATEKFAEGIRKFAQDQEKFEEILKVKLG
ncbi:transaldolase [Vibrio natriegens]|uniref:transaldolase n=1 Tax=Vibrio natriegens TaxID=691 RepID=UPI003555DD70